MAKTARQKLNENGSKYNDIFNALFQINNGQEALINNQKYDALNTALNELNTDFKKCYDSLFKKLKELDEEVRKMNLDNVDFEKIDKTLNSYLEKILSEYRAIEKDARKGRLDSRAEIHVSKLKELKEGLDYKVYIDAEGVRKEINDTRKILGKIDSAIDTCKVLNYFLEKTEAYKSYLECRKYLIENNYEVGAYKNKDIKALKNNIKVSKRYLNYCKKIESDVIKISNFKRNWKRYNNAYSIYHKEITPRLDSNKHYMQATLRRAENLYDSLIDDSKMVIRKNEQILRNYIDNATRNECNIENSISLNNKNTYSKNRKELKNLSKKIDRGEVLYKEDMEQIALSINESKKRDIGPDESHAIENFPEPAIPLEQGAEVINNSKINNSKIYNSLAEISPEYWNEVSLAKNFSDRSALFNGSFYERNEKNMPNNGNIFGRNIIDVRGHKNSQESSPVSTRNI